LAADAGDDQAVPGDEEPVLAGHGITNLLQLLAVEFDQLVALLAMQVVMLRVAIVMLKDPPAAQIHTPQEPRIDHFTERPVDSWTADLPGTDLVSQISDQVVGIKMLVLPKDLLNDHPPLPRIAHPLTLEILFEPIERLLRDAN